MSDSEKKKPCRPATQPRAAANKPCRPSASAPQSAAAKPCRPAPAPAAPATRPCRPSAPVPVSAVTARPSSRPSAEPVRTPPSRIERRLESPAPRPRAAPKPYATSTPKVRGEMTVGSFGALAGKTFPTLEERVSASERRADEFMSRAVAAGCVRVVSIPAKDGGAAIACIAAAYEEPRYFSGAWINFATGRRTTNEQFQVLHRKGYRHSRETAKLGDAFGRRTVVRCEADGGIEEIEIQESVPTHWLMSPDIPSWKSRAVPTEGNGSATRRLASDRGEECFRAIFDGPSVELASCLYAKRWPQYYADHRGTEATATLLGERLWDEIVAEEFKKAGRRLEYAFAIGEARFARLWNLAVATCTLAAKPEDATIDAQAVDASDVLPTS